MPLAETDRVQPRCSASACARYATRFAITACPRGGPMSMIESKATDALGRFLDLTVFRHSLITSNLANIDTPGFRTRDINFKQELERASGEFEYATFSYVARPVQ